MRHITSTILQCSIIFTLVFGGIATPVNNQGQPQIAHALLGGGGGGPVTVIGGNGTFQESLSAAANSIVAGIQATLQTKELLLDGIAYGLAKMVLKSMTQSIVNWINSGFEGSPAFISDLESFLVERADEIAGDFIYNDPALNFLCSPFQLDVKVALATSYQEQTRGGDSSAQCTLSDVSDNVDGFLSGNFQDGGWPAWFEVTQNPQNTPTGAFLEAEAELGARIANDQGQTIQELDWGSGFLSFKVCDGSRGAGGATEDCDITTPGSVIANQINKSLGAGQDGLIAADEINEIITALFAQLAQQAITGLNGLLGLGGSQRYSGGGYGANGNQSYLDAMLEEDVQEIDSIGEEPVGDAITAEQNHIAQQQRVIDAVDDAEERIERKVEMYAEANNADPAECSINITLPESLIRERERAEASIAESEDVIATLTTVQQDYASATDPAERESAMSPFVDLLSQDALTNEIDVAVLKNEIDTDLPPQISQFDNELNNAQVTCPNQLGSGGR